MSGGFFRGTSADQDTRFSNKQAKLLKSQKFAPELDHLVDMTKVKIDIIKPWIANRVTELLGFEDEVLINFIYGLLDGKDINGKEVQISLTGFMEKNTGKFMKELWALLLSAEKNTSGVPQQFLDAKEDDTRRKKAEADRIVNEIEKKKDKEIKELEQERMKKMDGGIENSKFTNAAPEPISKNMLSMSSNVHSKDDKGTEERNGRARNRVSRSPHSACHSPSYPRGTPSRSISKSVSNSGSYPDERHQSRSISRSPRPPRRSLSSQRVYHSPERLTPRRRYSPPGSLSPSRRRSSYSRRRSTSITRHRSPSPMRRRFRSPGRRISPTLVRRRSPPVRRRSRSPIRRRSRSPIRRRSRSPGRRRSRSPVRRRSRSPVRRRSRSLGRRRSPSPVRRRSPSPLVRRRSPSPLVRRRSPSPPVRRRSPSPPMRRRSPSPPMRRRSPSPPMRGSPPLRRRSPTPKRRRSPSPIRRRRHRSPTPRGNSPSPVRRRSQVPARGRSPSPFRRRSPSSNGWSSSSSIGHRSASPVQGKSPKHQHQRRSSVQSPRERIRTHEESSPILLRENVEHDVETRRRPDSLSHRTSTSVRLPQRDSKDQNNSRSKVPSLSASPEKSQSLSGSPAHIRKIDTREDGRSPSPYESRVRQTKKRPSPPPKSRQQKPRHESPETSAEEEEYAREDGEKRSTHPSMVGKQRDSPMKVHSKEEYSPERLAGRRANETRGHSNNMELRKESQKMKSEKASGRVSHHKVPDQQKSPYKDSLLSERQQTSYSGESYQADEKKSHPKDWDHKSDALPKSSVKVGRTFDSDSDESDKHRSEDKERRKHKRSDRHEVASDEDSYDSQIDERKETKRRKKEEKRLRKEERRRRREERRRRRVDRRAEKMKGKSRDIVTPPSDFDKNQSDAYVSNGGHASRREPHSSESEEAESHQKKLEIELRNKALESLRAKKGIGH